MQNKIISKALSLTAAAVLGCTGVIGSGGWMMTGSAAEVIDYSNDELFPVIVKVSGEAVMATQEGEIQGADFLETSEAEQLSDHLETVQERVQRGIRSFYPELDVKFSYSTLINGFYCELPESLIPRVEELSSVVSVTKLDKNAKLHMATAPELGGYPAYYDITGCTGEGSVVAVIDSELNADHPMFAPLADDVQTKVSREDVDAVVSSGELNCDFTTDEVYRSNKLPFVADYGEKDTDTSDPNWYHGTHVSGIAAGNEYEDADGKIISGIAKDAQLMFFKVSTSVVDIDFGAAIAATEDAVKLGADVINMSFGVDKEYFGDDPFAEAITTAENAGVMVCMAAANSDNGKDYYGRLNEPSNPDTCTLNDKTAKGQASLTVASADNIYSETRPILELGETRIPILPFVTDPFFPEEQFLTDILGEGEFEYVYIENQGQEKDYSEYDLEGKIVLCDYDDEMFSVFYDLAAQKNALGIIFIDSEVTKGMNGVLVYSDLPAALISYSDGQAMIAAEEKKISYTGNNIVIDHASQVSSYTSWGVKQSLDLRPDIMGVGGIVESAGYEDSTQTMSGTSMATPYLCGCVAEIMQYLRLKDSTLTGKAKIEFVHNLLMNSAIPYTEEYDGVTMFVTPRRQGAGLVSLDRAVNDKVLMIGDEGAAKVNLYDNLGDSFGFNVNLQNISDEDVQFTSARLELTTDSFAPYVDEMGTISDDIYEIQGQTKLSASADLSALTNAIAAGETQSVGLNVSLDPAQTASLLETFKNGFFVEGYLVLEGAENCCDISIPLLGFYGDWAQIPIMDEATGTYGIESFGYDGMDAGQAFANKIALLRKLMDRIPLERYSEINSLISENEDGTVDFSPLEEFATPEEWAEFTAEEGVPFISPNGDGLADRIQLAGIGVRFCKYTVAILDEDGNQIGDAITDLSSDKGALLQFANDSVIADLPNGNYTLRVTANIDYASSYENPQVYELGFTVDKDAPEVTTSVEERDGRTILTLTATDNKALDGVYITGIGYGGLVGEYDPENINYDGFVPEAALDLLRQSKMEFALDGTAQFNDTELPTVGRILNGTASNSEHVSAALIDVIPATVDEDGVFTIEYDITDLENYTITVMDKAYNMNEVYSGRDAVRTLKKGVWYSNDGFYEITKGTIRLASYEDGDITKYNYTISGDTMKLYNRVDSKEFRIDKLGDQVIRLYDENGTAKIMNYMEEYYTIPNFRTLWEIENACMSFYKKNLPYEIESTETIVHSPEDVEITYQVNLADIQVVPLHFRASMFSDEIECELTWFPVNMFEIPTTFIQPGTYIDGEKIYVINNDNETGSIFSANDYEVENFSYVYNEDDTVTITSESWDEPRTVTLSVDENNGLYLYDEDGSMLALYQVMEETITSDDIYRLDQLEEMMLAYEGAATGVTPEYYESYTYGLDAYFTLTKDGSPYSDPKATYQISVLDATGTYTVPNTEDYYGYEIYEYVDLKQIPELTNAAYTQAEITEMAQKDYEVKNGVAPASVESRVDNYGRVQVRMYDEEGNVLDTYTIHADTGAGYNSTDESINLPQTGNNAPAGAVAAAAALAMMTIGAGAAAGSGVLRKKKDAE